MKIKTITTIMFILLLTSLTCIAPVSAVKPSANLASAEKVPWHLSADVMPVPPYGSRDIPGSDTASKLIVNQPNGNVEVVVTGVMNGLNPNTPYTVFLSNSYEPYVDTGWNVEGTWMIRYILGGSWDHDYIINVQSDGAFSGIGGWPAGAVTYTYTETIEGTIDVMGEDVEFHVVYNNGYWLDAEGTIASDGTMSGTWGNTGQGYGHDWLSISGSAVRTHTGDDYWTGLFTGTVPPFTFTTDEYGAGSWHLNLRDSDFPGPGTYALSVWINEAGATMLISDSFDVVVD